ncbi:tyrosine-protein kinase SRK2 isoform X4 [Octopus sinensis]|uniref:Tyrosine-protein kinase n=1 Tax=Octopus sinensis TaxID=2607531 RepID=A0A6P7S4S9_9MOLL|nr:tyrosine-protein kinase SRK2 isoform X4 [Octopus sinensis]
MTGDMFCRKKKHKEWLKMAKAGQYTLKEKIQEEFLECKICFEPYVKPKALPCLHSFCAECLKDYVRKNPDKNAMRFCCPICRKEIPMPPRGIDDFQDNFWLLSLSNSLEEGEDECRTSCNGKNARSNVWTTQKWNHQAKNVTTASNPLYPPSFQELKLRGFDWYFGKVSRNASEEWLLHPGLQKGSFLIRQGEALPDTYTLSVRDCDELRGYLVKHYKILSKKNGDNEKDHYYITAKRTFSTLEELVSHYSVVADGLCCKLTQICDKPRSLLWAMDRGKPDEFMTTKDTLQLVKKIGSGQFAEVYYAKWNNQVEAAVKMQKKDCVTTAAFLDEAQILKSIQHNNIVKLLAVCSDEPVYLVTEYMVNGRLSQYLREGKGKQLGLTSLLWISAQIAGGMAYMETENFIHRNLGARNILVGDQNLVKIAGFGMSKVADDPDFNFRKGLFSGLKMAVKWMAPEVLLYNKYSTKADIWSFGIVLMEIFSYGKEPYDSMGSKEAFEKVQSGYRMPCPQYCPAEIYNVALTCWNINAPRRPSFDFLNSFLHDCHSTS